MKQLSWVMRTAVAVLAGALLVTATVVAIGPRLWRTANAHEEVPIELPEFAAQSQRSIVYDAAGQEMSAYELENTEPVDIDDLPKPVIDAFLAVEDNNFWTHHGVNVRSLFRASLSNFAADGPTQGASTITMQVVKNDYLAGLERDGRYKLLQITYAVRLEKQKSKRAILERYLNTVFFGQNSYGVGAAAETYFGKPATELTFVESAFLAGLVQAPTSYDPVFNPDRSRVRFNQVLDRLVADELLTEAERAEVDETFVLPERVRRRDDRHYERTHVTEAVRDYLLNRSDILGDTYEERYTTLHRGGLRIHTTIDPVLQAKAERARLELPENSTGIDAAMTAIENRTGAIRAMAGGRPFEAGENEVNLALAPSQTGSSVKFFILAAALEAGATPDDIIDGRRGCTFDLPGLDEPFVISGGIAGSITNLREQTTRSVNCAFAKLSMIVGLNRMVDTIYRMAESPYLYKGQSDVEREPILPIPSMATGGNELSTLDLASGMQTIANQGIHQEPYFIESIENADGEEIYVHAERGARVLSREAALTAIDVLKGPMLSGTADRELGEFAERQPAIGKTGTQDSNVTATFVGATPYMSAAVLVRDPKRYTEMQNIPEFEFPNIQGGTYPARIWGAFMEGVGIDQGALSDWPEMPEPERDAATLALPGIDCATRIVGYTAPQVVTPTPTPTPAPDGGDGGDGDGGAGAAPQNAIPAPRQAPETSPPAPPGTTPPGTTPPVITTPPQPIYEKVDTGTTVPPDVVDPNYPMPSIPLTRGLSPC